MVQTKEEKKHEERNTEQTVKFTSGKAGLEVDEATKSVLGFGAKPTQHNKNEERVEKKGGKKGKIQFNADDFPSL